MNTPSPCDKCMFLDYDGWNDYSQAECSFEAEMGKSDCPHFVHWNSDSKLKLPNEFRVGCLTIRRHLNSARTNIEEFSISNNDWEQYTIPVSKETAEKLYQIRTVNDEEK